MSVCISFALHSCKMNSLIKIFLPFVCISARQSSVLRQTSNYSCNYFCWGFVKTCLKSTVRSNPSQKLHEVIVTYLMTQWVTWEKWYCSVPVSPLSLSLLRLYHHGSVVVTPYSPEPQDCYSDLETKCHCRTEESPCGWQCPWSQYRWYTHSHRHRLGHTVVCGWPHLEPWQPVTTQCQTMCVHMCMWVYIKMDAHTLRFCIRTHHLH